MAWTIELSDLARANLKAIDPQQRSRILRFLQQRVSALENPRSIGQALHGAQYKGLWRYRVGDYRIIADIVDHELKIIAIEIGHRREVYR
jgi:mRNA interferase RelE/StbE